MRTSRYASISLKTSYSWSSVLGGHRPKKNRSSVWLVCVCVYIEQLRQRPRPGMWLWPMPLLRVLHKKSTTSIFIPRISCKRINSCLLRFHILVREVFAYIIFFYFFRLSRYILRKVHGYSELMNWWHSYFFRLSPN